MYVANKRNNRKREFSMQEIRNKKVYYSELSLRK